MSAATGTSRPTKTPAKKTPAKKTASKVAAKKPAARKTTTGPTRKLTLQGHPAKTRHFRIVTDQYDAANAYTAAIGITLADLLRGLVDHLAEHGKPLAADALPADVAAHLARLWSTPHVNAYLARIHDAGWPLPTVIAALTDHDITPPTRQAIHYRVQRGRTLDAPTDAPAPPTAPREFSYDTPDADTKDVPFLVADHRYAEASLRIGNRRMTRALNEALTDFLAGRIEIRVDDTWYRVGNPPTRPAK